MVKQGDIIWLDFDPQSGHEQKGRRPALVVSNNSFGRITGYKMIMLCPITNTSKDFPLHVKLDRTSKVTGVVMCEQVKVLDVQSRNYEKFDEISEELLDEVLDIVSKILIKED